MATLPGSCGQPGIFHLFSCKFYREIREIGKYNIQQRGKNYPCRKRNTFPSSKDKKFLLWRVPKNPLSA
jgi:hypothetical protein